MTTEEKFHAAVNVIRSLPKNGSYQPSRDLMLKFYAYFKQATLGPCTGSRPAFWDIVGRAKYDAWKSLGNMPKSEAMAKYVDELHSIVETMSYSDNVATFLEAPSNELESLNLNMNDLELVVGDVLERVRSQPNSPLGSREASPTRLNSAGTSLTASPASSPSPEYDDSDDEYIDTIESPEPKKYIPNGNVICDGGTLTGYPREFYSRSKTKQQVDVSKEISKAVQSLKADIDKLSTKVTSLENRSLKKRGIFGSAPTSLIIFIVVWPFVANFVINRFLRKKS